MLSLHSGQITSFDLIILLLLTSSYIWNTNILIESLLLSSSFIISSILFSLFISEPLYKKINLFISKFSLETYILHISFIISIYLQLYVVSIPSYIRQHSRLRSGPTALTFVGFRVRTDPDEYVDNFNIFFDQLKFSTNALSNVFDGYELKNVDFGDSGSNGSSSTSSTSQGDAK